MQVLWVTRSIITEDTTNWKDTIRAEAKGIVEQCRSIQKVAAGEIISCSFEVVGRTAGAAFSDATMEVDGDDLSVHSDGPTGASLMCVTQLGLKGRERLEWSTKAEFHNRVLLKAKVFLQDS